MTFYVQVQSLSDVWEHFSNQNTVFTLFAGCSLIVNNSNEMLEMLPECFPKCDWLQFSLSDFQSASKTYLPAFASSFQNSGVTFWVSQIWESNQATSPTFHCCHLLWLWDWSKKCEYCILIWKMISNITQTLNLLHRKSRKLFSFKAHLTFNIEIG